MLLRVFKFIFLAVCCAWIVSRVDITESLVLLGSSDGLYLSLFLALSLPMIYVSCLKWKLFIPSDLNVPVFFLCGLYLKSYFANLFLPATIGGDIQRSIELSPKVGGGKKAARTVVFDRAVGLVSLLIFALPALVVYLRSPLLLSWMSAFLALVIFSILCLYLGKFISSILSFSRTFLSSSFPGAIHRAFAKLNEVNWIELQPKVFAKAVFLSGVFYLLAVLNVYLALLSLDQEMAWTSLLIPAVVLTLIVTAVPMTPANIGIQEGALIFFLSGIGVPTSLALGAALLLRLKVVFLGLLGGVIYAFRQR